MNAPFAARRWAVLALVLCGGILSAAELLAVEAVALAAAEATITVEVVKRHVDVLADDVYEGREAGSRGGRAAAGYVVQQLEDLGFQPGVGGKGFYQVFGGNYRNVLALLPGSDESLREEVILVGAHYDHVGYGSQRNSFGPWGYVHNGADDNASGSAGLLGVAAALSKLSPAPRRTVLIAFWDGEEKGLLGSKHWMRDPTVSPTKVALAINMDMIGRLRQGKVEVYGTRSAPGLREFVARANDLPELRLAFPWEMKENSDHYTFFSRSMPTLMFHTGLHGDYHRPSDDADKVNAAGVEQVARLVFRTVVAAADRDAMPKFRSAARSEGKGAEVTFESPLAASASRMGVSALPIEGAPGLRIATVTRGGAAERAGLRAGDVMLKFGGYELPGEVPLSQLIWSAGKEVEIELAGVGAEKQPRTIKVFPSGHSQRIGLAWRVNDAEPGSVAVVGVTAGAAGDLAGIKRGDRILTIEGESLPTSAALLERFQQPGPFALLIERQGQLLPLTIAPVFVPAK